MPRLRPPRRGAAALEFAATLPVLLLMLAGIIDYGLYFLRADQALRAVREGARYGARLGQAPSTPAAARDRALEALESLGVECGTGCTVSAVSSTSGTVAVIRVSIAIEQPAILGILPVPTRQRAMLAMAFEDQF